MSFWCCCGLASGRHCECSGCNVSRQRSVAEAPRVTEVPKISGRGRQVWPKCPAVPIVVELASRTNRYHTSTKNATGCACSPADGVVQFNASCRRVLMRRWRICPGSPRERYGPYPMADPLLDQGLHLNLRPDQEQQRDGKFFFWQTRGPKPVRMMIWLRNLVSDLTFSTPTDLPS